MRWEALFADLGAQAEALARGERASEVDERTRGELAALAFPDRLRAAVGADLRVLTLGSVSLSGVLRSVGGDWLLIDEGGGREAVVPLAAVLSVRGLTRSAARPSGAVETRLGLRAVLRRVARDRSPVRLHLRDGSTLDVTIDRVGNDYIDVAVHAPAEPRRQREVRHVEVVPLTALAAVRRLA